MLPHTSASAPIIRNTSPAMNSRIAMATLDLFLGGAMLPMPVSLGEKRIVTAGLMR
jgi:hypothetical protein